MRIDFELELSGADQTQLQAALGCDAPELEASLTKHAKAALSEYVAAYLGRRAFTRGTDMLEHRLSLLIEHVFENRLPTEREISLLFQSSPSASRTLLRNTLSRYRYHLREQSVRAAKAVLEAATWSADKKAIHLMIVSPNLLEALNEQLRAIDPTKKGVTRLADSVATFETSPSAYSTLCKAFGARAVVKP